MQYTWLAHRAVGGTDLESGLGHRDWQQDGGCEGTRHASDGQCLERRDAPIVLTVVEKEGKHEVTVSTFRDKISANTTCDIVRCVCVRYC